MKMLISLLGAFSNYFIRGGGVESAFLNNRNVPGLRYVNALIYGGLAWYLSHSMVLGCLLCIGMFFGSTLSLGEYIIAMQGEDEDHSRLWGIMRMSLRGAIWGSCIALTALISWTDVPMLFYPLTILAGATQGIVVYQCIKNINWNNNVWNFWTISEMIHGAILWATLCLF